jgi:hypothetical protein
MPEPQRVFDNRPRANYRVDMAGHEGEVMGPGLDGRELLAIAEVRPREDGQPGSAVIFRTATQDDVAVHLEKRASVMAQWAQGFGRAFWRVGQ